MADLQVTCINKQPRNDTHEGITHLGGNGWRHTRGEIVFNIDNGVHTYYTLVNGRRAEVKTRNGQNGKYVQTVADGYWTDNLLAMPECR
jgi:uncharacterized protein DUF3892